MSNNGIGVVLYDAESGEEIEGVDFLHIQVVPAVGSIVHYWQDGTGERATGVPVRRDFLVDRVRHDWRFMPGRMGGQPLDVTTVELFVTELPFSAGPGGSKE